MPKLQRGAGGAGESSFQERMVMTGRLVCDTYLAAKDLIRSKSYRLTDLADSQLKIQRQELEFDKVALCYESSEELLNMIQHCAFDAYLSQALMFKLQILPLTKQLTNLAGNMWSRTMTGARAERNEYLLLHEFHRQKYICPDKTIIKASAAAVDAVEHGDNDDEPAEPKRNAKSRRKPAFTGGLVLEPKKGFYDKYVLLLDFNSLYPSIIQEYNVCFTTVERHNLPEATDDGKDVVPEIPDSEVEQGMLPRLLKTLVERRRQVKKLMKDPKLSEAERMQFDIRQMALKLTANSMYGCLGFSHSRFFAKPLAMLITYKGREILQNTVDLAGTLGLNVIYGDTDSIMVYTNERELERVKEMGTLLKRKVNERYRLLEIDIDGFFRHMLLLKKKKYAARLVVEKSDGTLQESVETKGLDLVRRDWCDLSHDMSSQVLDYILSDKERDDVVELIHDYLTEMNAKIRGQEVSLDKYTIHKQLTKNPEEYADAKSQPHVQVAIRMRQAGKSAKAGDTIPYVICSVDHLPDGAKAGFAEKAYHPEDFMRHNMAVDIEWYLNQQVLPPIVRLCSPIEGTDPGRLAECLGLDKSKFRSITVEEPEDDAYQPLETQISDEERFKEVDKLQITCGQCRAVHTFEGVAYLDEQDASRALSGLQCQQCKTHYSIASVQNQMTVQIRQHIQRYYACWLVCDETTCGSRTRHMSVYGHRCLRENCLGRMRREYTDKQLYTQLLYYSFSFDPAKARQKAQADTVNCVLLESILNRHHSTMLRIKGTADKYLEQSGYRHVDLSRLFANVKIA